MAKDLLEAWDFVKEIFRHPWKKFSQIVVLLLWLALLGWMVWFFILAQFFTHDVSTGPTVELWPSTILSLATTSDETEFGVIVASCDNFVLQQGEQRIAGVELPTPPLFMRRCGDVYYETPATVQAGKLVFLRGADHSVTFASIDPTYELRITHKRDGFLVLLLVIVGLVLLLIVFVLGISLLEGVNNLQKDIEDELAKRRKQQPVASAGPQERNK